MSPPEPLPSPEAAGSKVLRDKLQRFSVSFGTSRPEEVVLVLFEDGDPARGFAEAQKELARGIGVRLVGPGVTLRRHWPSWVEGVTGFVVTELGAFVTEPQAQSTRAVQDAIRVWLRRLFPGALPGVDAARALFPAACARAFHPIIVAYPACKAVATTFEGCSVRPVDPAHPASFLLEQLTGQERGPQAAHELDLRERASFAVRALASSALAIGGTMALELRAFVDSAPTRMRIRQLWRKPKGPVPRSWVGMVPDWYRINHHLLDAFALPEVQAGHPLGVLLVGSVFPGERQEARLKRVRSKDLWPGLGKLRDYDLAVEQAVVPDSAFDFAFTLLRAGFRSGRVAARLAREPIVVLDDVAVPLRPHLWSLAKFVSTDLMRARLALRATERFVRRVDPKDREFIFVTSGSPQFASVDLFLQSRAALTVDHPHGGGGDNWTGGASVVSKLRCVWTATDVRCAAASGDELIVAGMPRRHYPRRRPNEGKRVLVMTNYAHRDSRVNGRFPFVDFQEELLDVVKLLRLSLPDLEISWRPHPADDEETVNETLSRLDRVELSRGRTLEEDVAWADLLVSSFSTVVVECVISGVPLFVHALPHLWDVPASDFLDPKRLFFRADEGAPRILAALRALRARDPRVFAPEQQARAILFGTALEPAPMSLYFGASATKPAIGFVADREAPPISAGRIS